jgi:predicted RND superfamily exporter protein
MEAFSKKVVKFRFPILIAAILLMIPSVFGYLHTRTNYDILTYLPDSIDTIKGQNILKDEFGKGAFSLVIFDGMSDKEIAKTEAEFKQIDHVNSVIWYDDVADLNIPKQMIPSDVYKAFNSGDSTLMAVFFDTSTSADETMNAITQMRKVAGKNCYISGMSMMVTDLKNLTEKEEPIYVGIAVILSCIAMMVFMDSYVVPLVFLANIGIAIVWNLGTNQFLGEVSFITKALAAVLQLAVTMDYSIFLWHSFEEQLQLNRSDPKSAMAKAIAATIVSVTGSSITTVAGFIAMCFMTFKLGMNLGIVMAKGVILGVLSCVTVLPALILLFGPLIEKTRHRNILPDMHKLAHGIIDHRKLFIIIFIVVWIPASYGYHHIQTYYDMGSKLPKTLQYSIAREKMEKDFKTGATHMILAKKDLSTRDAHNMIDGIEKVKGVKNVLAMDSFLGPMVPKQMIPSSVRSQLTSGKYQLMIINSEYSTGTDQVNSQITKIQKVMKRYDKTAMLIGEAPCTKDLITISNHDFNVVNAVSIAMIFLIIALVLQSFSLPFILVGVIEFAIFINLGIPFYTHTTLVFIASICISTIQLGATVDYAILMTTRYKTERYNGKDKRDAIETALAFAIPSIIVSAAGFFAATFGVAVYSDIDIISSLCTLLARGAIISMLSVIFILPSLLMLFDHVIIKTSKGFINPARTGLGVRSSAADVQAENSNQETQVFSKIENLNGSEPTKLFRRNISDSKKGN